MNAFYISDRINYKGMWKDNRLSKDVMKGFNVSQSACPPHV